MGPETMLRHPKAFLLSHRRAVTRLLAWTRRKYVEVRGSRASVAYVRSTGMSSCAGSSACWSSDVPFGASGKWPSTPKHAER